MRGSLRHRGNPGTWEYRLEMGAQPAQRCVACNRRSWLGGKLLDACPACGGQLRETEERRERTVGGFRLQSEAQAALDKAKVALQQGDYVEPAKLTVRTYLVDMWLPGLKATVALATQRSYAVHVETYIVPRIGGVPLQRLSPEAIDAMYADLLSSLSPSTVHLTHVVLHRALKDAVRRGRLARNPTDRVDPPRAPRPGDQGLKTWNAEQLGAFFAATRDHRLGALWHTLAMTGLRRGEALGLRWEDVDLEAGRLSVRRSLTTVDYVVHVSEPKTTRGRRMLPLDTDTVEVLKAQAARQLTEQQQWGEAWTASGYVFTAEDGQPLHPDRISKSFGRAVRAAMLPHIRLHDLRHTWATLALRAGVHPKVVQERLGHGSISVTLDTYSHAIPAMQEEAADLVAALVAGNAEAVAT